MKTLTKKQKEANGENFSRIMDDAAILLQRKADYVMNIKQVADYLCPTFFPRQLDYRRNQNQVQTSHY